MRVCSKVSFGVALVVWGALATITSNARGASCDATGADAAAVASARAAVRAACDCAGTTSAPIWGRCVRATLKPLIGNGLSSACERHVRRIETRSTCGRPERVVCCRTSRTDRTVPSLRPAGRCSPPSGGSSCESPVRHLDEGCTSDGCVPTPVCGNAVREYGEMCDPPDGLTCSDTCTTCPHDGCTPAGQHRFCGAGPVTAACSISIGTQAACEQEGGCWDKTTPFIPEGTCNCPTLDAGKACRVWSDCEGLCISSPNSASCESRTVGACSETRTVYGCFCLASVDFFYEQCIDF